MKLLKAACRISFLFLFCFITRFAGAQTWGTFTKYENDKYRFSFSYPGEYILDKINDDEWVIRKADRTWAIGFKILYLQGKSYDSYVNSLSTSLFNSFVKGYGLSATYDGTPYKNPYGKYLIGGFEFDLFICGSLGSGTVLEKLTNTWNLYLNIFRKTSHTGFVPDGIIIYDFRGPIDIDGHKLTKQVINTFEKTVVFKEAIVTKPVITTVAKKKPVTITPVVKKPVAPKPPVKLNPITKTDKPVNNPLTGKLTDPRDGGGTYHTVKIGTQTWMSENLDVSTFLNGDPIPEAKTVEEWKNAGAKGKPAWCYYNNNNNEYGKLYNWYAVHDSRGLAPKGWHVSSEADWGKMIKYLGGDERAPNKLKAGNGWRINIAGSIESGFAGLPGKWRSGEGVFLNGLESGSWWTSSYKNYIDAAMLYTLYYAESISSMDLSGQGSDKKLGASVRCVKN